METLGSALGEFITVVIIAVSVLSFRDLCERYL